MSVAKKIIYFDMDYTLVDFMSGVQKIPVQERIKYTRPDDIPNIFSFMEPMPGAVEAYKKLAERFDCYVLSTATWDNITAWSDKRLWVEKYLGEAAKKRLILTHHKDLCLGDYLIDDNLAHGAERFKGKIIQFGKAPFETWADVLRYFENVAS